MKRFWTFAYDRYYPGGGMEDFTGQFDTEADARAHLDKDDSDCRRLIRVNNDGTYEELKYR